MRRRVRVTIGRVASRTVNRGEGRPMAGAVRAGEADFKAGVMSEVTAVAEEAVQEVDAVGFRRLSVRVKTTRLTIHAAHPSSRWCRLMSPKWTRRLPRWV